ncbi:MAG: radical SAM protein [Candidatus Thiodiazotropha sp.]
MKRIEIVLNVTNGCNLDCHYCYYANEMKNRPSNMRIGMVESVMRKVANSDAESIHFSIHGGEPLLRKSHYLHNIFKLQQHYLHDRDVRNSIQTNGTLFDEEFIADYKAIVSSGVNVGLGVSLDGPKYIHDSSRVYKKDTHGSYEDVMRGIELLAENNIEIALLSVANLNYAAQSHELYPFYKSLTNVHFLDLLVPRKDSFPAAYKNSLSILFNRVFDDWFYDADSRFEIRFFCSVIIALLTEKSVLCTFQENCILNQNMISIAPDGESSFCDSFPLVSLGNIQDDSVDTLIDRRNKTRMKWSVKEEQRMEHCLFCKYYKVCHGGCPADYSTEGIIGPFFCDQYKKIFNHIETAMYETGVVREHGLCEDNILKFPNPALQSYLMHRGMRNQSKDNNTCLIKSKDATLSINQQGIN